MGPVSGLSIEYHVKFLDRRKLVIDSTSLFQIGMSLSPSRAVASSSLIKTFVFGDIKSLIKLKLTVRMRLFDLLLKGWPSVRKSSLSQTVLSLIVVECLL